MQAKSLGLGSLYLTATHEVSTGSGPLWGWQRPSFTWAARMALSRSLNRSDGFGLAVGVPSPHPDFTV